MVSTSTIVKTKGQREREAHRLYRPRPRLETRATASLPFYCPKKVSQCSFLVWIKIFLMMRRTVKIHCKVHKHRWGQEFRIFFAIYLPQMAYATCISQSDFGCETLFHIFFYFLNSFKVTKKLQM